MSSAPLLHDTPSAPPSPAAARLAGPAARLRTAWGRLPHARLHTVALVALILAGFALRFWVALRSRGTNDIVLWSQFAEVLSDYGVRHAWEKLHLYNHPPLIGYFAVLALKAQTHLGIRFEVAFKLLPMLADVVTALVLYRIWQRRSGRGLLAVGLHAACLVSVLITGYHGNTDSAVAACALLAAYLVDGRRFLLAGLALGVGVNIKLVPVLCIPVLAACCRDRKQLGKLAGGLAVAALPFVYFAITAGRLLFDKVIGYQSSKSRWGLYGLLELASQARNAPAAVKALVPLYWQHARYLPVLASFALAVLALAVRRRQRWSAIELTAAALAAFLVFTPGFGVQYMVYALAPLLAVHLGVGFAYGTVAGLFLLLAYVDYASRQVPYYSYFDGPFTIAALPFAAMSWLILLYAVGKIIGRPPRPSVSTSDTLGDPLRVARQL